MFLLGIQFLRVLKGCPERTPRICKSVAFFVFTMSEWRDAAKTCGFIAMLSSRTPTPSKSLASILYCISVTFSFWEFKFEALEGGTPEWISRISKTVVFFALYTCSRKGNCQKACLLCCWTLEPRFPQNPRLHLCIDFLLKFPFGNSILRLWKGGPQNGQPELEKTLSFWAKTSQSSILSQFRELLKAKTSSFWIKTYQSSILSQFWELLKAKTSSFCAWTSQSM